MEYFYIEVDDTIRYDISISKRCIDIFYISTHLSLGVIVCEDLTCEKQCSEAVNDKTIKHNFRQMKRNIDDVM